MGNWSDIRFPLGGLNRRFAKAAQPPYTTPDCLNVRPDETIEGRERGGSRPGLAKFSATQIGGGAQVNSLCAVEKGRAARVVQTFLDSFTDPAAAINTTNWEKHDSVDFPGVTVGYAEIPVADTGINPVTPLTRWCIQKTAITNFDLASTRVYDANVSWQNLANGGSLGNHTYTILAEMDNTTPDPVTDAIRFSVNRSTKSTPLVLTYTVYVRGTQVISGSISGVTVGSSGRMTLVVTNANLYIRIYDGAGLLIKAESCTLSGYTPLGAKFGFELVSAVGVYPDPPYYGNPRIYDFRCEYYLDSGAAQKSLLATANGQAYYLNTLGTMTADTGDVRTNTTESIQTTSRSNTVYLGDFGSPPLVTVNSGSYVYNAGGDDHLQWAGVADYTALGIDADDMMVEITEPSNAELVSGSYLIESIDATDGLVLKTVGDVTVAITANRTCTFRICRCPKKFDFAAVSPVLERWVQTDGLGFIPLGCTMLCRYRDRALFSGDPWYPNAVFASRQGDWTDYDYGADPDDPGRAWALTVSEAGEMAEPVTAVIPGRDDYLMVAGLSSLWVLRGDTSYGGQVANVSGVVGCVSRFAWCEWHDGTVYILSRNGLYAVPPGANGLPVAVSIETIPAELLNIDTTSVEPILVPDLFGRGIYIFLTRKNSAVATAGWLVGLPRGTFWPMSLPNVQEAVSAALYSTAALSDSDVVVGCRDGYLRSFRKTQATDDGTAIASSVVYGPVPLGGPEQEAVLNQLVTTLDDTSGSVACEVRVADTPEAVLTATALFTETLSAGISKRIRRRARGGWMTLTLTSTNRWAIDQIRAEFLPGGPLRVR